MTEADIGLSAPCLLVRNTPASLSFYRDRLGFTVTHQDAPDEPVFGIVQRGGAMVMLKDVGVPALPNAQRHIWARWDVYFYVPDPDALAAEFAARQVEFSVPLKDTPDGLRGFELRDLDDYVLFFGRPRPSTT